MISLVHLGSQNSYGMVMYHTVELLCIDSGKFCVICSHGCSSEAKPVSNWKCFDWIALIYVSKLHDSCKGQCDRPITT